MNGTKAESVSDDRSFRCQRAYQASIVALAIAILVPPSPAASQDAHAEDSAPPSRSASHDVEEIIIVGETLPDLDSEETTSSTVFQAAALEAMGVTDVSDISQFTPNVEIRTSGSTTAQFFVRGVGLADFSANATGSVAVYLDEVPMNSSPLQLLPVFDIESIHVLRGPQGSGAARNASAGAIKIRSRKPSFQTSADFTASLGSIVSSDARNAVEQAYSGAFETSLLNDVLGARFAFTFFDGSPYIVNGCGRALPRDERPGNLPPNRRDACGETTNFLNPALPPGIQKWIGQREQWAVRSTWRLAPPGSDVDIVVVGRGSRLDRDSAVGQVFASSGSEDLAGLVGGSLQAARGYQEPDQLAEHARLSARLQARGLSIVEASLEANRRLTRVFVEDRPLDRNPFRGDYNRVGRTQLDTYGGSLDISGDWHGTTLRSITGFDAWDRFIDQDADFTPNAFFETEAARDNAWQVSQELNVTSEREDAPLRWEAGANALAENIENSRTTRTDAINFIRRVERAYEQNTLSFLVFGDLAVDFWDNYFTLDAGIQYNWIRKDFFTSEVAILAAESTAREIWDEPTYTIGLTFHPTDSLSIFGKFTHGFKAGHFNTNTVREAPAAPELIDAFEIGFYGAWLDNRLKVRGALFHYDYENYQTFNFESQPLRFPQFEIINANAAEVIGAELEISMQPLVGVAPRPLEDFEISLRGGWLETQYLDFVDTQATQNQDGTVTQIVADFTGNPLANAPGLSFSGSLDWAIDVGRFGTITPRWDFAWTDDTPYDSTMGRGSVNVVGDAVKPRYTIGQHDYWIHNWRVSLTSADTRLEIAGWCRNATDERYKTYAFDATRVAGIIINFVGDPRTCGGDATFRW